MTISTYEKEAARLAKKINSIQTKLSSFPPGYITIHKNGKYKSFFQMGVSPQKRYLARKDKQLISLLLQKKYLTLQLEELTKEKNAIDSFLTSIQSDGSSVNNFIQNPDYARLIKSTMGTLESSLEKWKSEEYEKNPKYPEQLRHKSISGNVLRSKSEVFIDQLLYLHRIPYRYECKLQIGEVTLYPDFTILHPTTGEIIYWEHFGMMDSPSYSQNAFQKLQLYAMNGIIPGHRLITTYESKDEPLDVNELERIVSQYFL